MVGLSLPYYYMTSGRQANKRNTELVSDMDIEQKLANSAFRGSGRIHVAHGHWWRFLTEKLLSNTRSPNCLCAR